MPREERPGAQAEAGPQARDRLLLIALAAALVLLAILRPPETYAWSGATCKTLLAAAGCLAWLRAGGLAVLPAWTAGLLPLALASLLAASCRARALDEAAETLTLILAALLGRALALDGRARVVFARLFAALGALAAVLAVLQHHVTYPEELKALLAEPGSPSVYVVARLQAGRPSGPFTLPAALGGFFALTLPLTLLLARCSADRWQKSAAAAAALLQIYALFLTRSIGGLLATSVSLAVSLPFLAPRRSRLLVAMVPVAAIAVVFLFLQARRAEVTAPGGHPLALRAGNWRAAAEMIGDHPLFGTGPGSFGTFYPRYLRPGMNETRYAHDSYLQVISGWGLWSLVPLCAFVLAYAGRLRRAWRRREDDLPFVAAGAAFLVHNLIDFTAYLPGVAIPAALLIGLALRSGEIADPDARLLPRPQGGAVARAASGLFVRRALPAGLILALFLGHSLRASRAAILLEEARASALEGNAQEALAIARRASRARPDDPMPRGFIAEWVLTHGMDDGDLRGEGRREAETAVRLDPESAILHYDLSLYHQAEGRTAAAFREHYRAHLLFPLKETYALPRPTMASGSRP